MTNQPADINLEQLILSNLLTNDKFMRKVLPFIQPEYFEGIYKDLFKETCKYAAKYNRLPQLETFKVELDNANLTEESYKTAIGLLPDIFSKKDTDLDWLVEKTEKWCQDKAVFNAIMESITIIDNKHKTLTKNALPDLLQKALAVTFDTSVGHDYLEDTQHRYAFYHEELERIPFDIENLNTITKGGLVNKSLNVFLAGTGVGKSLAMCSLAASSLSQGFDVLYITMEMSEERIAERIDANLLDVPIDRLNSLSKEDFINRIASIRKKSSGKLIIKEYPTAQASTNHFRALLNELKLKKKFKPKIIFIDYLNICASSRMKGMGGAINSYSYIKAIAEEVRGLAVEFDVPIVTATQTTRSGFSNSDPGLEDTSESFGLPATADLMLALVSTEELEADGKIMIKQLKNRYNDPGLLKRFVVGIDRNKMRLTDPEGDTPMYGEQAVFDKSQVNERFKDFKL